MASKRQMAAQIRTLKDDVEFEKAKTRSAVKIIKRLSSDENTEVNYRLQSYWNGYWHGKGASSSSLTAPFEHQI